MTKASVYLIGFLISLGSFVASHVIIASINSIPSVTIKF